MGNLLLTSFSDAMAVGCCWGDRVDCDATEGAGHLFIRRPPGKNVGRKKNGKPPVCDLKSA